MNSIITDYNYEITEIFKDSGNIIEIFKESKNTRQLRNINYDFNDYDYDLIFIRTKKRQNKLLIFLFWWVFTFLIFYSVFYSIVYYKNIIKFINII